tara:strand:+ start:3541 stop:4518 length:978 start_codon:yes stop_codon:yes gene_type:complete
MEGVKIPSRQQELVTQAINYNYEQNLAGFQTIADQIAKINYKLLELREDLRIIQPKLEGSISLVFNNCGKESHKLCGGCPHPVFKKWTKSKKERVVSTVKNPKHSLKKTGAFKDCYDESRLKIDEINKFVDERGRLLKMVGSFKKAVRFTSDLPTSNEDKEYCETPAGQRGIVKQAIEHNYKSNLMGFQFIAEHIASINSKLFELREDLRVIQPKLDGSISLGFTNCGKEDHKLCGGCPHPTFNKWTNPQLKKPTAKSDWWASAVKNPKRALEKTGAFKDRYAESKLKIDEISKLIEERTRLLKMVGSLKKAIKYTSDLPDPNDN